MRKALTVSAALFAIVCLAQEQPILTLHLMPEDIFEQSIGPAPPLAPIPTRHIVPEDIVPETIGLVRFSTNSFAVRWTYTEGGANKMLAFREAHEGRVVRTVIGSFESRPHQISFFSPMPPTFKNYAQWKEGWLKRRTDKIFVQSEQDAEKIMAGLKSK